VKVGIFRRRFVPYGGGERFVRQFADRLARVGHDVHLFSERWTERPAGVTVHRVPTLPGGSAVRTFGYACLAPRLARAAGVEMIHSFERTFWQDIYRAGEGCHRQWLALRRRYLRRSVPGLDRCRPFHAVVLAIEGRICAGRATRLIAVNSRMVDGDFVRHYGPRRVETTVVRNGVDLARFEPAARAAGGGAARAALGLGARDLVLVAVGSGFRRKGIPTAIRALGDLRRRTGAVPVLLVAGNGRPGSLQALAVREGVAAQLRVLGVVSDASALYAAADLFVLPSVYDPASSATLEALASGLPVITTSLNGSSEIIEHGRSGFILSDPGDASCLSRLIEEAADPDRRRVVGEAGRRAVEPFTWERHLAETLALYARARPVGAELSMREGAAG
jgi:UDP-glucose:(heptosyl)LPS alpha-1,3-glucosyltransferase